MILINATRLESNKLGTSANTKPSKMAGKKVEEKYLPRLQLSSLSLEIDAQLARAALVEFYYQR